MVNSNLLRDINKQIANEPIRQELPAGSPRRYEPESGIRKHNERIHKESRYADTHKNLPFTFRKPQKPMGRSSYFVCDNCGKPYRGTTVTVGVICNNCGKFSTVSQVEEEDLNIDWEG